MKRVVSYVAGPMSGLPRFNAEAFDCKAAELRRRGHLVHSPPEIARAWGLDLDNPTIEGEGIREALMREDLARLLEADEVHVLEGWERSKGVALELDVARACGLRIVYPRALAPSPH